MAADDERRYDGELNALGRAGEAAVEDFFAYLLPGIRLENVSTVPYWQDRDVDFLVHRRDGKFGKLEAKSDKHIYKGLVLFELLRIHHTAKPEFCAYLGWSVFSEAERLAVWCPPTEELYFFEMSALRVGMQRYSADARKQARLEVIPTDIKRSTLTMLIPLSYVPHRLYCRRAGNWLPRDVTGRNS